MPIIQRKSQMKRRTLSQSVFLKKLQSKNSTEMVFTCKYAVQNHRRSAEQLITIHCFRDILKRIYWADTHIKIIQDSGQFS